MSRQERFNKFFMSLASQWAQFSYCKKRQVGCVIVRDNHVICSGFNGTEMGHSNCCEDEEGKTLPSIRHAEINAISRAQKDHIYLRNATLYCTLAPCIDCANEILFEGITKVVYIEESSKGAEGLAKLKEFIEVEKVENDKV